MFLFLCFLRTTHPKNSQHCAYSVSLQYTRQIRGWSDEWLSRKWQDRQTEIFQFISRMKPMKHFKNQSYNKLYLTMIIIKYIRATLRQEGEMNLWYRCVNNMLLIHPCIFIDKVANVWVFVLFQMDPTLTPWNCVSPPRLIYKKLQSTKRGCLTWWWLTSDQREGHDNETQTSEWETKEMWKKKRMRERWSLKAKKKMEQEVLTREKTLSVSKPNIKCTPIIPPSSHNSKVDYWLITVWNTPIMSLYCHVGCLEDTAHVFVPEVFTAW